MVILPIQSLPAMSFLMVDFQSKSKHDCQIQKSSSQLGITAADIGHVSKIVTTTNPGQSE